MRHISTPATKNARSYQYTYCTGETCATWNQIYQFLQNNRNDPFNRTDLRLYDTSNRRFD